MKWNKYIIISLLIFLVVNCEEENREINSLIIGKWQLSEIYMGSTSGWIKVEDTPKQTKEFMSNWEYLLCVDGNIWCKGSFNIENDSTIRLKPADCLINFESVEVIYSLTVDSLIMSDHSLSISSFNGRKEKYFRII